MAHSVGCVGQFCLRVSVMLAVLKRHRSVKINEAELRD